VLTANKTEDWIESKSDEEKRTLINEAMKESHLVRENFKKRKVDI